MYYSFATTLRDKPLRDGLPLRVFARRSRLLLRLL